MIELLLDPKRFGSKKNWKRLFAGTVPANKNLFAGTVPANKNLFAGTPSVGSLNIFHLRNGFFGQKK